LRSEHEIKVAEHSTPLKGVKLAGSEGILRLEETLQL
jgi:hypothetical protein